MFFLFFLGDLPVESTLKTTLVHWWLGRIEALVQATSKLILLDSSPNGADFISAWAPTFLPLEQLWHWLQPLKFAGQRDALIRRMRQRCHNWKVKENHGSLKMKETYIG